MEWLRKYRALFWALVLPGWLFGCATRYAPYSSYRSQLRETPRAKLERSPVIFFLIDGLAVKTLQTALVHDRVPHLRRYFLAGQREFQVGQAVFPTLTYPNITSILTGLPVAETRIIGNQVLLDGEVRNFERIQNRGYLNDLIRPQTIFTRLAAAGRDSLSLAHYFYGGTTVRQPDDLHTGIEYLLKNYEYVDNKAMGALEKLVKGTRPRFLPDVTFVHLIGVDSLEHEYGPNSPEVQNYLAKIDEKLALILDQLLEREEDGEFTRVVLTADHGFTELKRFAKVAETLAPTQVLNEGRLIAVFTKPEDQMRDIMKLRALARNRNVGFTAFRAPDGLKIFSREPLGEDSEEVHEYLAKYFAAPNAPTGLVLAANGVNFRKGYLGNHGGLTREEREVPVLARNAELRRDEKGRLFTQGILAQLTENWEVPKPTPLPTMISGQPGPAQTLNLSVPTTRSYLSSEMDGAGHRLFTSGIIPSFRLGLDQAWSKLVATSVQYQFDYLNYDDVSQTSHSLHRFEADLAYRFGETERIFVKLGLGEDFFLASPTQLEKAWVPELGIGTKSRVLSTGFGDLGLYGGLSMLARSSVNGATIFTGFRQHTGAFFDQPVAAKDLLEFFVEEEYSSQDTSIENRHKTELRFGACYSLSFQQ